MKRNEGKYEVYDKLPKGAILVKEYAKSLGIGEPAVYNQYTRAKEAGKPLPFKIIIYFERNFILPE